MGEGCDGYVDLSLSAVREATTLTAKILGKYSFMYTWQESTS